MGIIKAGVGAIGGNLADQWLETIEPLRIDNTVLASYGTMVRKDDRRSSNKKGTQDVISNGSIIHVPENVYMLLVDGGKIISATDEAGYYQVDNSRAPSFFFKSADGIALDDYSSTNASSLDEGRIGGGRNAINRPGGFINTFKDSWERFKFGGTTPVKQQVIYINKQEIPDIRFGTKNPISYTDRALVPGRPVPCKITSFGTYSIKVLDPLLFYAEVCAKTSKSELTTLELAEQYTNEFLMAYATALSSLSFDNVMVSDIVTKTAELGRYMAEVLDKEWLEKRGFYIQSVGIAGISFDEKTDQLLEKYANDSILFDPNARAARMTGSMAAGLEAAGSNQGGAMLGFAGMAMGMNAAAGMGVMPNQQAQQPVPPQQQPPVSQWTCECGNKTSDEFLFCAKCGKKKPEPKNSAAWTCTCGNKTSDEFMFCAKCGAKRPAAFRCNKCGWTPEDPTSPPAFCPKCGDAFNEDDSQS